MTLPTYHDGNGNVTAYVRDLGEYKDGFKMANPRLLLSENKMKLLQAACCWVGALASLWLAVMSRATYRDSLEPEFIIGHTYFIIHYFWIIELTLAIFFAALFQSQKKALLAWVISQILFCQFTLVSAAQHYIFWTAPTTYEMKTKANEKQ